MHKAALAALPCNPYRVGRLGPPYTTASVICHLCVPWVIFSFTIDVDVNSNYTNRLQSISYWWQRREKASELATQVVEVDSLATGFDLEAYWRRRIAAVPGTRDRWTDRHQCPLYNALTYGG